MRACSSPLLALGLIALAAAQQFVPIPSRPEGFTYPRKSTAAPSARFDVFMDLNCSDCKAFYPEWKKFIAMTVANGAAVSETSEIHYHLISLPFHHNSFFCHKLAAFIEANHNDATLDYFDTIFDNQEAFLTGAVDMNESEVKAEIASISAKGTGISEKDCLAALGDRSVEMQARTEWKWAVSNGIVGTPGIMLNGVTLQSVPETADEMYKAWEAYLTYSQPQ